MQSVRYIPPPPPRVEPATSPLRAAIAGHTGLADALGEALARGAEWSDITAVLHEAVSADEGLAARVKSDLDAIFQTASADSRIRDAARAVLRWLDVGTVVFVSPEAWPISKGGGLASAVAGRAASLAAAGLKVHVITPLYASAELRNADGTREHVSIKEATIARAGLEFTGSVIEVPTMDGASAVAAIARATISGVDYIVLDSAVFADALYGYAKAGNDSETRGVARLAVGSFVLSFGAMAGLESLRIRPSVIVGNDWMCAHLAVVLAASNEPIRPGFVAWIHNNGEDYQFRIQRFADGVDVLDLLPVPPEARLAYVDPRNPGKLNFQAGLVRSADYVVSVSPEQKAAYIGSNGIGGGDGLRDLFRAKDADGALLGIPNGVNVTAIQTRHFGLTAADACSSGRAPEFLNQVARARHGARRAIATQSPAFWPATGGRSDRLDETSFVVTMMTRMTAQKGIDLAAIFVRNVLDSGRYPKARFVFAGDGDECLVALMRGLSRDYPGVVGFADGFIDEHDPSGVYHNVYLSGNLLIAFSLWEPGGLSVMEALALGCPCLVSDRQGHQGTVKSVHIPGCDAGNEPGFNGARYQVSSGDARVTEKNILAAFDVLYTLWNNRDEDETWNAMETNALLSDNSWESSLDEVETLLRQAASLARKRAPNGV